MTDNTEEYLYYITQKVTLVAAFGAGVGATLGMQPKIISFNSKDFKLDHIDTATAALCIAGSPIKGTLLVAGNYLINLFLDMIPAILKGISKSYNPLATMKVYHGQILDIRSS